MKTKSLLIFWGFLFGIIPQVFTQNFDNAFEYLKYIKDRDEKVTVQLWDYISTKAHSQKNREIDKSKDALLKSISISTKEIQKMPVFKNDASLRDSMISYFYAYEKIITGDYAEIEALEYLSDQSYAAMKKYLDKVESVNETIRSQRQDVMNIFEKFALKNDIELIKNETEISAKMVISNIVNNYYDKVHLIYFRTYIAKTFLISALNDIDTIKIDIWTDSLKTAITVGLVELSAIEPYNFDNTLILSCKKSLETYKLISNIYLPAIRNYFTVKDNFDKLKIQMNNIPKSMLTQAEVDNYNKNIDLLNKSTQSYNLSIQKFNSLIEADNIQWQNASSKFIDKNIPK